MKKPAWRILGTALLVGGLAGGVPGVVRAEDDSGSTLKEQRDVIEEEYKEFYDQKWFNQAAGSDRQLTLEELNAADKIGKEGRFDAARFALADVDKNGVVTHEEARRYKALEIAKHDRVEAFLERHPKLAEDLAEHPEAAEALAKHPRLREWTRQHPRMAGKLAEHPRAARYLVAHPNAQEILKENPGLAKKAARHPEAAEYLAKHPNSAVERGKMIRDTQQDGRGAVKGLKGR